jgi:hypothetical protein
MALLASLRVDLLGDMADLSKKLDSASAKLEAFGKKAEQIGKTMSKTLTAPIVAFGGASVRAFGIQEDAERKLAAAIRATGGEVDKNLDRFKSFASEMQRLTVVGDETTLRLLQVATAQGLSADSAERATKNAISMQSAFGVSAESAIRMTAALEQGDATMLRRYIPALRGVEDEAQMLAKAHEILAGSFGIAEEEARTTTGSLKQLKNQFGDFMEQVGSVIADAMLPFVEKVKDAVTVLQGLDKETLAVYVRYAALAASAGPILMAVGAFAKLTLGIKALTAAMLANPYTALGAGLLALGTYAAFAAGKSRLLTHQFHQQLAAQLEVVGSTEDNIRLVRLLTDAMQILSNKDLSPEQREMWEARAEALRDAIRLNAELMARIDGVTVATQRQTQAIQAQGDARGRNQVEAITELYTIQQRRIDRINNSLAAMSGRLKQVAVDVQPIPESLTRAEQAMFIFSDVANTFVNSFGAGMSNIILQTQKWQDALKNVAKLLLSAGIQKAIQLLLMGGIPGLSGAGMAGFFGDRGGLGGSLMRGLFGRASGGRVTGGSPYMVGERGPELFVPGSTGGIISNGGLAGSGSVNVTGMFRISGSDLVAVVDNSRRTYR